LGKEKSGLSEFANGFYTFKYKYLMSENAAGEDTSFDFIKVKYEYQNYDN
jgi:hypothetical protein